MVDLKRYEDGDIAIGGVVDGNDKHFLENQ
jgi:hypothetical protein